MNAKARKRRIICAHLLDDYSGSAKIFSLAISELRAAGADVRVVVGSAGTKGFIRAAHPVETIYYRFRESTLLQALLLGLAQMLLFFRVMRHCLFWRADVVYANTVLTPGAILAGRVCGRRVVAHLQEVGLGSRALFKVFIVFPRHLATTIICVSRFVTETLHLSPRRAVVLHNTLPRPEWQAAADIVARRPRATPEVFRVLMACSLKWYKGIDSFLAVASRVSRAGAVQVRFRLVLNCEPEEWQRFASAQTVPGNVELVFRPANLYEHYRVSSLVTNLSHAEACVESFGLTLLEAMACGIPVVSPRVGGCVELFEDGIGGWRIDSRDLERLVALILSLATDVNRWRSASGDASRNAERFRPEEFSQRLCAAVFGTRLPAQAFGNS